MWKRTPFKKVKKDYERKNMQNPFFHVKKKGKSGLGAKWIIPTSFVLALLVIWFMFCAPFWCLDKIQITGLTRMPGSDLESIIRNQATASRWLLFDQSNIFLLDKEAAKKMILDTYNFSGLEINKRLPRTLEVKVSERPYAFIYQEGSQMNYASADAYLIREPAVAGDDLKKYFILENKNPGTLIGPKDKIDIKADYLNFITQLNGLLAAAPDLPVERYIIDQEFNTVKVKFLNGPLAYFSVKDDASKQLGLLQLVKKEKIKDNFSKTNYIDLRYGDRIFINPDFK